MNIPALHGLAAATALRRLIKAPLSSLLSAIVIAIALALPALGYLLADNAARLAQSVSGRPEISVFMNVDASRAEADAVGKILRADPGVAALRWVPREEALSQIVSGAGLGDIASTLGQNPLPDAFVISPRDETPAAFARLQQTVSALTGVAHVQLDTAWVQRLDALLRLVRSAVLVLAGLLGAALVIVTFNTIRLQILTQRHEIGVSLLLGATRSWVRRPFLYFGALQGTLGGVLAWALVVAVQIGLRAPVAQLADAYGIPIELLPPGFAEVLGLIGFAAFLGWSGAALSVRRHLHDGVMAD
ncbi:permease-like cell division protein FtsX [Niveibacterium terrae]|uniref:permease-like cell division protein FtsX n=1 Tax=Niveibacterium terrae TaxID=3373598 RepID=UPI003A910908